MTRSSSSWRSAVRANQPSSGVVTLGLQLTDDDERQDDLVLVEALQATHGSDSSTDVSST